MTRLNRHRVLTIVGLLLLAISPVSAQEVTLKSADGSVELSGELLEFNGEYYRIRSNFGELTLNALGVSCVGHACPDPGQYAADITIAATPAIVKDLLPGLIEDFGFRAGHITLRQDHGAQGWTYFVSDSARIPVARLQAKPAYSAQGLAALAQGQVDLAISERLATSQEVQQAKNNGSADPSSPHSRQLLAVDGLIFVVSPQNPVSALTIEQLSSIYSGQINNWAELGGVNAPISLFSAAVGSDKDVGFRRVFFSDPEAPQPIAARAFASDEDLSNAVLVDPFAIGLTGFAGIRNTKPLAIKGACGIQQSPTAFGLQSGDYPLARNFYIFHPAGRLPVFARNFLTFLDSGAAQDAITDLGYVGLALRPLSLSRQQDRISNAIAHSSDDVSLANLKNFVRLFSGARRLSASFRFNDNSKTIDARSRRNIRALAEMIEVGDFDGKKLIFAGFSDSQGSAVGNRRISEQRAEQVAALVKAASTRADLSKINIQTLGMGEVSPLACNDDSAGRGINRRVEVWVK
jgi:phosphate transport system substrate-binding protein